MSRVFNAADHVLLRHFSGPKMHGATVSLAGGRSVVADERGCIVVPRSDMGALQPSGFDYFGPAEPTASP